MDDSTHMEVTRAVSIVRRDQGIDQIAAVAKLDLAAASAAVPLAYIARLIIRSDEDRSTSRPTGLAS